MARKLRWMAACLAVGALAMGLPASAEASAGQPRIDLRVLVVDDGGPATAAIAAELAGMGTPYTTISLADPARPIIDSAFLRDTIGGDSRGKFQSVVLPNDNPFGAGSAEMTALASYERDFDVRQVDAYTYAQPAVGLNWAVSPGYMGSLDGTLAQVTPAGLAGPFSYLKGSVPFEDNNPGVAESYGYLAVPLADDPVTGATFTSYVTATIPGTTVPGSLVGAYTHGDRSELVVTFVYNENQTQYRLLARGIVEWMTEGIHLGYDRSYFSVHVDDVFLGDDRWSTTAKCTPGDVDCLPPAPGQPAPTTTPIRMTAADAAYAKQWSQTNDFTLDMVFNGGGSDDVVTEYGTDPLADRLSTDADAFRWINHTYQHPFLGCQQDTSVVPWVCAQNQLGQTQWISQADITTQITTNRQWAATHGLTVDDSELVTGEHSGLKILPQQQQDNPNLAPALAATDVRWIASDHSRDPGQRAVGPALTASRYPMNVFYNVGTAAEQVDEYNWIYTSAADGGSGSCENSTISTCITPLSTTTGYQDTIVPIETRIAFGHVAGNDPRPHFVHQANLAEERLLYPVLEGVLDRYHALYADNAPLLDLPFKEIGQELRRRAAWNTAVSAGEVTAYRVEGTVTVQAPTGVEIPLTVPDGTTQRTAATASTQAFGSRYAGHTSGWTAPARRTATALKVPAGHTPAPVTAPARRTTEPRRIATPPVVVPEGARTWQSPAAVLDRPGRAARAGR